MFYWGEKGFYSYSSHKTVAAIVLDFGRGRFGCVGVCGCSVTILSMVVVGNTRGGNVEIFGGGGQGERNGRHQDDHQ